MSNRARWYGIRVMTTDGPELVLNLSDYEASVVGHHHNAVKQYTRRYDPSGLDAFVGVQVGGHELETRLDVLDWWAMTGELDYESIYEQVG